MIERVADAVISSRSLEELEGVIERGLKHFMDVGSALIAIRDGKLYQATHRTFDGYLRERWGFRGGRAYQLMAATDMVKQLSTNVDVPPPKNEAQARELARIADPEHRAEVWGRVVSEHGEKATAADVRRAARSEDSPAYDPDPPLLSVVDVETGEIIARPDIVRADPIPLTDLPIDVPDIRQPSDEERAFDQLIRMSTITQMAPDAVATAGVRYRASSARSYRDRAEAVLAWHEAFISALRTQLGDPIRAIK